MANRDRDFMWKNGITGPQVLTHLLIDDYCSPDGFN
jgi:hypothetical protein